MQTSTTEDASQSATESALQPHACMNDTDGLDGATKSTSESKWAKALQRLSKEDQEQFKFADMAISDPQVVLNAVLAATQKRRDDCLRKRWKVVIKEKTVILRDVFDKLLIWVHKLMAIGDVAVQYDPVCAALPWAAIRLIMQISVNDLEVFGHVLVSVENVANTVARCHIMETLYLENRTQKSLKLYGQLSDSIVCLYAAILQYLTDVMHYYGLNTAKRLTKSIAVSKEDIEAKYLPVTCEQENFLALAKLAEAEDLGAALGGIENIEQELQDKDNRDQTRLKLLLETLKDLQRPIDRIDTQLREIHDGLKQDTRTKILKAISTIPYGIHHKTASKGRLEGSGRWLLKKLAYDEWRRSSSSSVLWLHGIPGSGKTKLTSLVVDELRGHEHVAYFYCLRNPAEPQRAQSHRILASLVRQLASFDSNTPILPPVVNYYEEAIAGFIGFEDQAWTTDECTEVLLQLLEQYPAVSLVLDALDEVNHEERQELLDALTDILQKTTCLVRVFISSRSNYDIALYLSGSPNVYIEADDNAEDISSFIDKQLASAKLLHGKLTPSLRDEVVTTLKAHAQGMFRWVELQIQSLRLLKVAADLKARLGVLPDTLEGSYWEIFQQIRDSGDNAFRLATFTFQWLLYTKKSISMEGFAVLASNNTSASTTSIAFTSDEVLDVCSNLIVKRQASFDFAHLSVREFFERLHNREINEYLPNRGHAAIAQACFQYLNLAMIENRGASLENKVLSALDKLRDGDGVQSANKQEFGDPSQAIVSEDSALESEVQSADRSGRNRIVSAWQSRFKEFPSIRDYSHELFAVVSSDIELDVPSGYVATHWTYHLKEAGDGRLDNPLTNIIRSFLLEKSTKTNDSSHDVARGFRAWCAIVQATQSSDDGWINSAYISQFPPNPIWVICDYNWLELVKFLYEHAYPRIDDSRWVASVGSDVNPLWYAIFKKKADLIDVLAQSKADTARLFSVEIRNDPLVVAAINSDTELILVLSKQDYGGREVADMAFKRAAEYGQCESMKLLMTLSLVSIEQVGHGGLCMACAAGEIDAVNFLLNSGVSTAGGASMLYRAVLSQHLEVVRLLLSKNIGLDGLSNALVTAISNGDSKCVELLSDAGAKKDGAALIRAIRDDTQQTALRLITAGFDIHGRYLGKRRTALHYAASKGQLILVKALLENSAKVNARDCEQMTPLHLATAQGHESCVRLLIDYGANILAKNNYGQLPLDIAEERNKSSTESFIRQKMEDMLHRLTMEKKAKEDQTPEVNCGPDARAPRILEMTAAELSAGSTSQTVSPALEEKKDI